MDAVLVNFCFSKWTPKLLKFGHNFVIVFKVLELFKCFLRAFSGLPRLSWTALDPKKYLTHKMF